MYFIYNILVFCIYILCCRTTYQDLYGSDSKKLSSKYDHKSKYKDRSSKEFNSNLSMTSKDKQLGSSQNQSNIDRSKSYYDNDDFLEHSKYNSFRKLKYNTLRNTQRKSSGTYDLKQIASKGSLTKNFRKQAVQDHIYYQNQESSVNQSLNRNSRVENINRFQNEDSEYESRCFNYDDSESSFRQLTQKEDKAQGNTTHMTKKGLGSILAPIDFDPKQTNLSQVHNDGKAKPIQQSTQHRVKNDKKQVSNVKKLRENLKRVVEI